MVLPNKSLFKGSSIYGKHVLNIIVMRGKAVHEHVIPPLWLQLLFFSLRLLWVLRGHSFFSSPPQWPMTSDFKGFSIPDFIHHIHFPILILEKEPVFSLLNVEC